MIRIEGLRKEYDGVIALKGLDLALEEGDAFGFIGPNGAGKTTTIDILATLVEPTSGTARIAGYDLWLEPKKVRQVIGYMPDFFGLYEDLKVWEYLDFFGASYGLDKKYRLKKIEEVLELTNLTGKRDSLIQALSRGMRQRLCLAKTLVHDPKVLLLDEPASGLDPRARVEIRELLKKLKRLGKTIFVSSHILPELSDICNKIGIIEEGVLLATGGVEEVMSSVSGKRRLLIKVVEEAERAAQILRGLSGIEKVELSGDELKVTHTVGAADVSGLVSALLNGGIKVISFNEEAADLEDVFMKISKGILS